MNDPHDLGLVLKSHLPLVRIETHEEPRICALLAQAAAREKLPVYTWTVSLGLRWIGSTTPIDPHGPNTRELATALRHKSLSSPGIFIFLDPQPFLDDPLVLRLLKEVIQSAQSSRDGRRKFVLVGAQLQLPDEFRRYSARFELPLATTDTVRRIFSEELEEAKRVAPNARFGDRDNAASLLIQYLAGLCEDDVRRMIRDALYDDHVINLDDVQRVLRHKQETLGESGVLALERDTGSFANVGGQKNLKRWLERRKDVFIKGGGNGLDAPRGVLLLGVQGAGKSLAAKAIAGSWRVPLLRLDFGALYSKWSGETERNLRDSLKAAEAMAPCVLWADEIEKGIAPNSADNDGGVSRRVLGSLLTWMSERKSRVFVTATANDISQLPPELLRKGRFDEIFFVDLPDAQTRKEIFAIHLKRRGRAPETFDIEKLAERADGFSGSEIEQAVVSALYEAAALNQPLETGHVADELGRTRPLSVVMAEDVARLRAWAGERTVPAN